MTIVGAARPVAWLKKTPVIVPWGAKVGNSVLGIVTAGNYIACKLKGTELYLSKYNKILGRPN